MKRLWLLSAIISLSGCVRLSTYRQLQAKQQETAQSLEESRTSAATLKEENARLSADLDAAQKRLSALISELQSDLAQAQEGIAQALKRLG